MSVLVIDVGTSGVRAAVVSPEGGVTSLAYKEVLPDSPFPGLVEFDAAAMADAVRSVAAEALSGQTVDAVGIANQRASTVVWDRTTGAPIAPGLGWQDLRTLGDCLVLKAEGLSLAPNQSATKLRHLLQNAGDDAASRSLAFGTIDTWVAWTLSNGELHVTDPTNAGVTGLVDLTDPNHWDDHALGVLGIPADVMPTIVDSAGVVGPCTALPGAPPLAGLAGDQQASLIGQSCVAPGQAKATFGTGGMLDCVTGPRPSFTTRGPGGCFPIVARQRAGDPVWGVEAVMLSAGSCVEWLRDDLGLIASSEESAAVAAACADSGGVMFVPAMLGLGTPRWDYGARGTLLGLTRGSGRAEVVRAVLEGIAQRGADLVDAAEVDAGISIETLRIDGGMSVNDVFVQALADACSRPVEVSPQREATTVGAAYLAQLAIGEIESEDVIASRWAPAKAVEPRAGVTVDRDRWKEAVDRASRWEESLSALDF